MAANPAPSRSRHEYRHPVPETHELEGDDALNALHRTGQGRLAKNSFQSSPSRPADAVRRDMGPITS